MNKILLLAFISLFIITGCKSGNKVIIELVEKPEVISQLDFTISGEVKGLKSNYIFYQIEDGHGFLSEGKINLQNNGTFRSSLSIKSPTNEYGILSFYSDVNHNGIFEIEIDTVQKLGSFDLLFHKSIVM
ncbi:hypothetical protein [Paenibacillus segetis]|uniref:Uncharacterized protein n=1 Tax=Paenibacillus segetis TaxID=1325360 RepID=A0ABQ1Y9A5_9BACL|nr:hypothetical protein [Paenibacillus segetis]GGH16132.1 hypothetical protein GCM10008013_10730 [Paenibacillus segetis]